MTDGPMDFFGHRQVKPKQKIIHLSAALAEVRLMRKQKQCEIKCPQTATQLLNLRTWQTLEGRQEPMETQTWEGAGLEHGCDQGGAISPGMMAPLTPLADDAQ